MDSLATGLAVLVVLALPFVWWLRLAARVRLQRELDEVKALTAERSQWLDELHSRLDALDKQDSQREPMATEEATFIALRMRELLPTYHAAAWLDIAAKGHPISELKAIDLEALSLESELLRSAMLYDLLAWEAKTGPEWIKDVTPHESAEIKGLRRKGAWKSGGAGSLRGPVPQVS